MIKTITDKLKVAVARAWRPALKTALWMLKIMLPITLGVSILDYLGVVTWLSELMSPMFSLLGLPGEAGLVLISSFVSNIYSAVAVMASLSMDFRSVTILSVMCLIAHNMVIESLIQRKAGAPVKYIVPLRIAMAFVAAMVMNWILPEQMTGNLLFPAAETAAASWSDVLYNWVMCSYPLVIKMVVIIMVLNILQNILREFGVIELLMYPLRPLMKVFGLEQSTSLLWLIANLIGLAYGGAILIDEVERGGITHKESMLFNTHIAISHSLLEDTMIFVMIGIGVVWLIVPRMVLAIAAVWIIRKLKIFK